MMKSIATPRTEISAYAPRITTIKIRPERIKDVIGPGGKVIKEITAQTGCSINIEDDGSISIASSDQEQVAAAIKRIKDLTQEAEVGKTYLGTVRKIAEFGAFVEIFPGTDGLIHISELSDKRVKSVSDVLSEGEEVMVKVISVDRAGKIRLSRKEALAEPPAKKAERAAAGGGTVARRRDRARAAHAQDPARGRARAAPRRSRATRARARPGSTCAPTRRARSRPASGAWCPTGIAARAAARARGPGAPALRAWPCATASGW